MSEPNPYASLATDAVGGLLPYEPGMPPEELERRYGIAGAIKLASNENPYPLPDSVQAAMHEACADAGRYPDGGGFALREALAKHLGVQPNQITLGNGSNDVLVLLAEAFLDQNTSAIYDQYSFVVYRLAVQAVGAEARAAPSNPADHLQPLGHNLNAIGAIIDESTRLIFIANPNNPTGTWVDPEVLQRFIGGMPEHIIVVVDEAYFEYAEGENYPDTISWLTRFPNLVIVRTFSKAYGLAALRVGYAVSAPGVAELLNRVRQPFNCNSVAQAAALAVLQESDWVAACREQNAQGMRQLTTGLTELGISYVPSKGNFLLAHFGSRAAECNEFLLRQGVIVRPVANYGLSEYLRITIGTEAELTRLLAALAKFHNQTS